jgi:hypothetical protein
MPAQQIAPKHEPPPHRALLPALLLLTGSMAGTLLANPLPAPENTPPNPPSWPQLDPPLIGSMTPATPAAALPAPPSGDLSFGGRIQAAIPSPQTALAQNGLQAKIANWLTLDEDKRPRLNLYNSESTRISLSLIRTEGIRIRLRYRW